VEANEKSQVLAAIGHAATVLRTRLGETLASIQRLERHPVTEVTTPSLDAFQAYALGTEQYRRGLWLQAVPFFQRAVELDSHFAMAFQLLGNAYGNAGDESRQIEYSKKAFALIDRVSEREQLAISAVYHMRVSGDANKAADALELFVQTFPRATIPRANRGSFYTSMGQFERAADDYEELLRQDPRSRIGHMNLMQTYARLGLFDKARAVADEAFGQKLDAPGFHRVLLDIALKQDNPTGAANEIKWFDGRDDEYVSLALQASNAIVHGQCRKASDFLTRAAVRARRTTRYMPMF
jgi:eukaryotic-like serine/threonine-protein kinase